VSKRPAHHDFSAVNQIAYFPPPRGGSAASYLTYPEANVLVPLEQCPPTSRQTTPTSQGVLRAVRTGGQTQPGSSRQANAVIPSLPCTQLSRRNRISSQRRNARPFNRSRAGPATASGARENLAGTPQARPIGCRQFHDMSVVPSFSSPSTDLRPADGLSASLALRRMDWPQPMPVFSSHKLATYGLWPACGCLPNA